MIGEEFEPGGLRVGAPYSVDVESCAVSVERSLHGTNVDVLDRGGVGVPVEPPPVTATCGSGDEDAVEEPLAVAELEPGGEELQFADGDPREDPLGGLQASAAGCRSGVPVAELEWNSAGISPGRIGIHQRNLEAELRPREQTSLLDHSEPFHAVQPDSPLHALAIRSDRHITGRRPQQARELLNGLLGRHTEIHGAQSVRPQHRRRLLLLLLPPPPQLARRS